jgi:hypothetical protein
VRYEQNLQVQLRERYRRLYKTDFSVYGRELGYFQNFIMSTPALRAIVENLERAEADLDADKWVSENFSYQGYDWPPSEAGRAKIVWWLMGQWSQAPDGSAAFQTARSFSHERNMNETLRETTEQTVEPFVEYLEQKLGSESEILYLLERFKRRVELFEQTELYERYKGNTRQGESIYDRRLRKFLFDQGIDYPFSQPSSASGEADIVGELETDDPLVCEVKLYDGDSYGVAYIGRGLNQAVEYAHDYGKTVAHLVIINLSEHSLQLPSDEDTKQWPPRLHVSGVTVYLVAIRGKPLPSASKRGRPTPKVIDRRSLVDPQGS